jgi:hypothetical protein
MSGYVVRESLVNSADISQFLQIAMLLIFTLYFQLVRRAFVLAGNELVTVLLTGFYTVLHVPDKLQHKDRETFYHTKI